MVRRWARRPAVAALACASLVERASGERVVSLGDLHGDFQHAVAILRSAGLMEAGNDEGLLGLDGRPFQLFRGARWTGGNSTLVQTGDLVDRGTFARDLYALFASLREQAAAEGGRVVNIMGNHELLCLQGDLRYVSREDEADFGGRSARKSAFAASGWVGKQLLDSFDAAAVVGETLFVHAGLLPEWVQNGVDALNEEFHKQLQASLSRWGSNGPLLKATGPFWLRRQALGQEADICPDVLRTLELTGARRMVVGHTQVDEGEVRSRCGGRLLLADTIISRSGYPECWREDSMKVEGCQGSLSYLEFLDGEAVAVKARPLGAEGGAAAELERRPLPVEDEDGERREL